MNTPKRYRETLLPFLMLVFLIALPFWILGALFGSTSLPINLPLSSLSVVAPLTAALILSFQDSGLDGVKTLLRRALDYARIQPKGWYLPLILLMPLIALLSYLTLRLMGGPLPTPEFPIAPAIIMFAAFFVAAIAEELGWQGYAFERLRSRWNALTAAFMLGIVWAIWHLIPFIQTHHSTLWIAGQCGFSVGLRVVIVWLYNNTGKSVFAAVLVHTMANLSAFLFPNYGSHYDPTITSVFIFAVVGIVVCVGGIQMPAQERSIVQFPNRK